MEENSHAGWDPQSGADKTVIRPVRADDAACLCDLYNYFVETSIVTFDEERLTEATFQAKIGDVSETHPWFVYDLNGTPKGYALAGPWKSRCAYRYSVETTVYVSPAHQGSGIGTALYRHLIDSLVRTEVHSLIAGIALPNPASIVLHEKLGFEKIGHFKEVGRKFDKWLDVGYWELLIESNAPGDGRAAKKGGDLSEK